MGNNLQRMSLYSVVTAMAVSILLVPSTGKALTLDSTDLIAYWSCEETSGVRYDETANDNDLTDNNSVLYGTGIIGNACDFERGTSEYLSITDASQTDLDLPAQFSISWWIKPEQDNNATGCMFCKDDAGSNRSYDIWIDDSGNYITLYGFNGADTYAERISVTTSVSSWSHYVLVTDLTGSISAKSTLYKNGSVIGTLTKYDGSGAGDITAFADTSGSFKSLIR